MVFGEMWERGSSIVVDEGECVCLVGKGVYFRVLLCVLFCKF
jgi:hypothetical protein